MQKRLSPVPKGGTRGMMPEQVQRYVTWVYTNPGAIVIAKPVIKKVAAAWVRVFCPVPGSDREIAVGVKFRMGRCSARIIRKRA